MTAVYPAWIAFGVQPSLMLMGRPDTESLRSKHLRQALSVLQVSAAMGLASFTLAISWQARFAMDVSPGFDPAALVVFDLPDGSGQRTSASGPGSNGSNGARPAASPAIIITSTRRSSRPSLLGSRARRPAD